MTDVTTMVERPRVLAGVGRDVLWTYVTVVVGMIVDVVVAGLAVRRLGPTAFGYVAGALTVAGAVAVLDAGLGVAVVRAAARIGGGLRGQERTDAILDVRAAHHAYVVIGACAAVVSLVGHLVLRATVPAGAQAARVPVGVLLLGLAIGFGVATAAVSGVAVGCRQFRLVAGATLVGAALNLFVCVTLMNRWGVAAVGLGQLVQILVQQTMIAAGVRRHAPWFAFRGAPGGLRHVKRLTVIALPVILLSASAQLIALADLVVVGVVGSAATVGLYKLGCTIPAQAVALLYRGYDAALPSLAGDGDRDRQERATTFLTSLAAFAGGVVLVALALLRREVIDLLAGSVASLAPSVLAVFAGVWLLNVPAHGLVMLMIARGRERRLLRLVAIEAAANVALTIALGLLIGPIGVALATLVTLAVSNVVILPLIVADETRMSASQMVWRSGMAPAAAGATVSFVAVGIAAQLVAGGSRVVLAALLAMVLAGLVGASLLRREGRDSVRVLMGTVGGELRTAHA